MLCPKQERIGLKSILLLDNTFIYPQLLAVSALDNNMLDSVGI